MPGKENSLAVHLLVQDKALDAGLAEAAAKIKAAEAGINQAAATSSAGFRASRDAMIEAQRRASAFLKAGAKADVEAVGQSVDQMTAAYTQYKNAAISTFNTLGYHQQQILGDYKALMDSSITKDYEATVAKYDEKVAIDEVTGSLTKNTVALTFNAQAQREASYAVAEAATGRYGRLETSLFSLGARTGLMRKLVSPGGLSIAATAAPLAALTAALIEGERQSAAFNDAMLATGSAAGLSAGEFSQMAEAISGTDATIGTARGALLTLAQSGKFAGATLQEAGQGAVDFASLTGESMKEATRAIEHLAEKPAEALAKLNEQYHFLSVAQYEHVAALERQGDEVDAVKAAVEDFGSAMHKRAVQAEADEGFMLKGWRDLKDAISGTWEAMTAIGKQDDYVDRIAGIKAQLETLKVQDPNDVTGDREALEAQLRVLQAKEQSAEASAKQKSAQDAITEAGIKAQQYLDKAVASTKTQNALLEHEKELTQQIEALHKADAGSPLLKGDVFSGSGKLLKGNADYQAIIAKFQKEFSSNPIHLSFAASGGSALGNDIYRLAEQEIQDSSRTLDAINQATLQAGAEQNAIWQQVANEKQAIAEREIRDSEQTLTQINAAAQRAAREREQTWISATRRVEATENQFLSSYLSGRLNLASAERELVQRLATSEIEAVAHSVTEKLLLQTAGIAKGKSISILADQEQIMRDAAKAASGAFSAVAGIPYVGPILAPIAAATAFTAVEAYKNLAGFEQGAWSIPHDMPAMVHRNEMILPPPFADEVRARGGFGGGGGDTYHITHGGDINVSSSELRELLSGPGARDTLMRAIAKGVRNGARL